MEKTKFKNIDSRGRDFLRDVSLSRFLSFALFALLMLVGTVNVSAQVTLQFADGSGISGSQGWKWGTLPQNSDHIKVNNSSFNAGQGNIYYAFPGQQFTVEPLDNNYVLTNIIINYSTSNTQQSSHTNTLARLETPSDQPWTVEWKANGLALITVKEYVYLHSIGTYTGAKPYIRANFPSKSIEIHEPVVAETWSTAVAPSSYETQNFTVTGVSFTTSGWNNYFEIDGNSIKRKNTASPTSAMSFSATATMSSNNEDFYLPQNATATMSFYCDGCATLKSVEAKNGSGIKTQTPVKDGEISFSFTGDGTDYLKLMPNELTTDQCRQKISLYNETKGVSIANNMQVGNAGYQFAIPADKLTSGVENRIRINVTAENGNTAVYYVRLKPLEANPTFTFTVDGQSDVAYVTMSSSKNPYFGPAESKPANYAYDPFAVTLTTANVSGISSIGFYNTDDTSASGFDVRLQSFGDVGPYGDAPGGPGSRNCYYNAVNTKGKFIAKAHQDDSGTMIGGDAQVTVYVLESNFLAFDAATISKAESKTYVPTPKTQNNTVTPITYSIKNKTTSAVYSLGDALPVGEYTVTATQARDLTNFYEEKVVTYNLTVEGASTPCDIVVPETVEVPYSKLVENGPYDLRGAITSVHDEAGTSVTFEKYASSENTGSWTLLSSALSLSERPTAQIFNDYIHLDHDPQIQLRYTCAETSIHLQKQNLFVVKPVKDANDLAPKDPTVTKTESEAATYDLASNVPAGTLSAWVAANHGDAPVTAKVIKKNGADATAISGAGTYTIQLDQAACYSVNAATPVTYTLEVTANPTSPCDLALTKYEDNKDYLAVKSGITLADYIQTCHNTSGVNYTITSGADTYQITGGVLKIKSSASALEDVKVKFTCVAIPGSYDEGEKELTIHVAKSANRLKRMSANYTVSSGADWDIASKLNNVADGTCHYSWTDAEGVAHTTQTFNQTKHGAYTVSITQDEGAFFLGTTAPVTYTLTIDPVDESASVSATDITASASVTKSGYPLDGLNITRNSTGAITYAKNDASDPVTISGNTFTCSVPGTYTVKYNIAGDDVYAATTNKTFQFTVTPETGTLTIENIKKKVSEISGGYTLESSKINTPSTGAKTYTCSDAAMSISGDVFTCSTPGAYTINASQAAAGTYAAMNTTFTITVYKNTDDSSAPHVVPGADTDVKAGDDIIPSVVTPGDNTKTPTVTAVKVPGVTPETWPGDGTVPTGTAPGKYEVTVTYPEDPDNFIPEVTVGPVTVFVLGDNNFTPTGTNPTITKGDTPDFTEGYTTDNIETPTYYIEQSGSWTPITPAEAASLDPGNYNIQVVLPADHTNFIEGKPLGTTPDFQLVVLDDTNKPSGDIKEDLTPGDDILYGVNPGDNEKQPTVTIKMLEPTAGPVITVLVTGTYPNAKAEIPAGTEKGKYEVTITYPDDPDNLVSGATIGPKIVYVEESNTFTPSTTPIIIAEGDEADFDGSYTSNNNKDPEYYVKDGSTWKPITPAETADLPKGNYEIQIVIPADHDSFIEGKPLDPSASVGDIKLIVADPNPADKKKDEVNLVPQQLPYDVLDNIEPKPTDPSVISGITYEKKEKGDPDTEYTPFAGPELPATTPNGDYTIKITIPADPSGPTPEKVITYDVHIGPEFHYDGDTKKEDIDAIIGEDIDVVMDRTFIAGWNTICLPFTLMDSEIYSVFGSGAQVWEFSRATTDMIMHFTKQEDNVEIIAGVPYMIYLPAAVVKPTFNGVTIETSVGQTVTKTDDNGDAYKFTGAVTATAMGTGNGLRMLSGTSIKKPSAAGTLKASRCYYQFPASAGAKSGMMMFMNFNETTGIDADVTVSESENQVIYTIGGQRVKSMSAPGVYIVNGKKVVKK